MPWRETNNLDSLPVTFSAFSFPSLRHIDTSQYIKFSLWYFSPDYPFVIDNFPPLPLRGWFPVKWPRAPSSRDACIQGTSGKKEPKSRRWEPHTWLRNFYYSVDPNTGRGRIMAAWLPWEIQIQSVVTRLDLLEPRANARTKDRAHHASRRPTGNARNATVTFHVRSCCVCTWNTARPFFATFSFGRSVTGFVLCGSMELCCRRRIIGYYFSSIDSGSVDSCLYSMLSLWNGFW